MLAKPATDERLAAAVAVDVGGVEEGDARLARGVEHGERVGLVDVAPVGAELPGAEADDGDGAAGAAEGARLHDAAHAYRHGAPAHDDAAALGDVDRELAGPPHVATLLDEHACGRVHRPEAAQVSADRGGGRPGRGVFGDAPDREEVARLEPQGGARGIRQSGAAR